MEDCDANNSSVMNSKNFFGIPIPNYPKQTSFHKKSNFTIGNLSKENSLDEVLQLPYLRNYENTRKNSVLKKDLTEMLSKSRESSKMFYKNTNSVSTGLFTNPTKVLMKSIVMGLGINKDNNG